MPTDFDNEENDIDKVEDNEEESGIIVVGFLIKLGTI